MEAFSWYFQFINMLMSWSCSDIPCRHTVMHGAVLPLSLKLHHYCRQGHGMHYAFLFNNRCGSMNIISHTFVLWYCITRTPAWSLQWQSFIAQLESSFLKICNSRLLTSTALQGGFFFYRLFFLLTRRQGLCKKWALFCISNWEVDNKVCCINALVLKNRK